CWSEAGPRGRGDRTSTCDSFVRLSADLRPVITARRSASPVETVMVTSAGFPAGGTSFPSSVRGGYAISVCPEVERWPGGLAKSLSTADHSFVSLLSDRGLPL